MNNLKSYLDNNGYCYSNSIWNAAGIFYPMGFRVFRLLIVKLQRGKIIQRLDGVYYPSEFGQNYKKLNRLQKLNYKKYSDYIIFQSDYSRKQCFYMFGEISKDKYSIIYNGADNNFFYPSHKISQLNKPIEFITIGLLRNKVMLEPIIKALDELSITYEFKLNIVGPIQYKPFIEYIKRDYVVYRNQMDKLNLADLLRRCDFLLHTQMNDNCPNTVIEAISSGVPVIGFDTGAMSELCFFSKDLLAYVSDDLFQKIEDFDYKKFKDKIILGIENYSQYKLTALEYSHQYDMEKCGAAYVDLFNNILGKN